MENLWMIGEFPVDGRDSEIFFRPRRPETVRLRALCVRFRDPLRLIAADRSVELTRSHNNENFPPTTVTAAVHRFEESIAGRPYLIEVAAVSKDRWRAYIVRIPGRADRADAVLRIDAGRGGATAVRLADARACARSGACRSGRLGVGSGGCDPQPRAPLAVRSTQPLRPARGIALIERQPERRMRCFLACGWSPPAARSPTAPADG